MCDVGKELDNAANSVSNALGTDGSKNGLLNDPVSMAALAIGTGVYFAGPSLGAGAAVADAGTAAAGTISAAPAVAVDYGLNFSPTIGSVLSSAAGGVSDAFAAVPWATVGKGALEVGKAALPLVLNKGGQQPAGYGSYGGYPVRAGYQPDGSFVAISPNGQAAAYGQPGNSYNAAPAAGGSMLILLAVAALLVLNK